jgi:tRNA/rRNA methyltransferase
MRIRVVLSRPSHPGNIGAAARAMKTMGLAELALVAPRAFPHAEATALAAGATDVLEAARVYPSLEAAVADCIVAAGFSARRRELSHPPQTLREAAPELAALATSQGRVALVFGNETSGLSNEELARCQRFVSIPANPAYPSLNLAAAVQVVCYELAVASASFEAPRAMPREAATGADVERLCEELERVAVASGYLDPKEPGRFMQRIRRLFARAGLEREEVKILRGFLGTVARKGNDD